MNRYIIKEMSIKELASKLGYSYQYISAAEQRAISKFKRIYLKYFLNLASTKETRIDIRGLSYKRK